MFILFLILYVVAPLVLGFLAGLHLTALGLTLCMCAAVIINFMFRRSTSDASYFVAIALVLFTATLLIGLVVGHWDGITSFCKTAFVDSGWFIRK